MNFYYLLQIFLLSTLEPFHCYNTNRQYVLLKNDQCGYYENPVFKPNPIILQNRMGDSGFSDQHQQNPMIMFGNDLLKNIPFYFLQKPFKLHKKNPVELIPNLTPANLIDLQHIRPEDSESDEDDIQIDLSKLWQVGEIAQLPTKSFEKLPDVYVPGIPDDFVSKEQSELTEETHDMEDVEIEEKYLEDPVTQMKEVVFENIAKRKEMPTTENPAIAIFKQLDLEKIRKEVDAKIDEVQEMEKPIFEEVTPNTTIGASTPSIQKTDDTTSTTNTTPPGSS